MVISKNTMTKIADLDMVILAPMISLRYSAVCDVSGILGLSLPYHDRTYSSRDE